MTGVPTPQFFSPSARPALAGREREQAALREALAAALAGRGALVLISGEAGIGKTSLAEWALAEAAAQGALVLVGRCYDLSETPPYGPWREALAHVPHNAGLLPPPDLGGEGQVASQGTLFAQLRAYVAALAARCPLVLLLDDLHWADPASLDLLRVLARDLAALPVLLLAAYRADEIGGAHPLAALLPSLVREARAVRLDLRPLDGAAIATLVAARYALGAADRIRLVGYLTGRTEGNALFLGEVLRTLEGVGALRPVSEGWAVGDLTAAPVPALLGQVIAGRLRRLPPETVQLLGVAAVAGQEIALALWAAAAGTDEEALLAALEPALQARLVAETPDGAAVRFAHALIREALYESLPPVRRRLLHRRAGEALTATPNPDPDAVAYHFQRAGDGRAVEWLVRAGERAFASYAYATAEARFAQALPQLAGAEQVSALYSLSYIRRLEERGVVAAEAAVRVATEMGDTALAAIVRMRLGESYAFLGQIGRAITELTAANTVLDTLPASEVAGFARLGGGAEYTSSDVRRALLATPLALGGWYTETLAALGGSLDAALARLDALPFNARDAIGWVCSAHGRGQDTWAAFASGRAFWAVRDDWASVTGSCHDLLLEAYLPYFAGDLAARARLAAEMDAALARLEAQGGTPHVQALWALLVLEGRWDGLSERWAASGEGAGLRAQIAPHLGALARARGEREAAWRLVHEAMPAGPATAPGATLFMAMTELQRLAALLALDDGDAPAAHAWLAAHDRWLAWSGAVRGQSEGQLGWAAYYRATENLALARDHAERALAHATEPRQPLALLAAHRLLGELATEAGRHAEAQEHLDAALALAEACAAPYERALTLLALAEVCLAAGDHNGAGAALDAARAILLPLEARPALARAGTLAARLAAAAPPPATRPAGLSAREVEVLRLVAAGRSNREIAAALFLSERTVHAHLRHILAKTGSDNRAAAVAFALRHHLA
ncbi:MAG: ATP-binding protein [Thermomicrobiales bacterium]